MPFSPIPRGVYPSVTQIRPEALAARGIRLVLADLDNTLVPYRVTEPSRAVRQWRDALAAEGIAEHPFEPVAQEKIQAAKKQLEKCNRVICCRENFGSLETYQRELLEYAEQLGKRIEKPESQEQQRGC